MTAIHRYLISVTILFVTGAAATVAPISVQASQYGPVAIAPSPPSVISVWGGARHSIALMSDGTVWDWGLNDVGEIGNGTFTNVYTPVQVSGLSNVITYTARDYHNLAIKADGTVWAWGSNNYGQLGDNTTVDRNTPVQVLFLQQSVRLPLVFR